MSKVLKARVLEGRYKDLIVRISNVSVDDLGRKNAACILPDGTRANLSVTALEVIKEESQSTPETRYAKTASMPFISGSSSSRTLTHTKNMSKARPETKAAPTITKVTMGKCESCGQDYNLEERKGQPGKLTQCENCAEETETMMEGKMIFSHKTGATIEIKKDGELRHEAEIFDPKGKT
jgi:RNA polymerase-binding transcription factor DksA